MDDEYLPEYSALPDTPLTEHHEEPDEQPQYCCTYALIFLNYFMVTELLVF